MEQEKKLAPIKAITENQMVRLNIDNTCTDDYWMLLNTNHITITKQTIGNNPEGSISIPKKDFNKLIRWYTREQKLKPIK